MRENEQKLSCLIDHPENADKISHFKRIKACIL